MRNFVTGCFAAIGTVVIAFSAPAALAAPSAGQPAATEADTSTRDATPANAKKSGTARSKSARQARSVRKSSRASARSAKAKNKAAVASKQDDKAKSSAMPAADQSTDPLKALPTAIANANAEMIEIPAAAEAKPAEPAVEAVVPETGTSTVAASDQINELDRAAMSTPRTRTINASFEMRDETDFAQTSLIGRIFIAIGALLIIGSAVRMVIR